MAPTSANKPAQPGIQITLVMGLLGSGKTTAIQSLIKHKPHHQRWALLINEFGEVDIDGVILNTNQDDWPVQSVTGGCICCSAQMGLSQAMSKLIALAPDRILIEPTGLGHPAQLFDILRQFEQLTFGTVFCITTPAQLTPERWQKSSLLRNLVTLSDVVILNKTDLATADSIAQAMQILQNLYPAKQRIIATKNAQIPPGLVDLTHIFAPFLGFEKPAQPVLSTPLQSCLDHVIFCQMQMGQTSSMGWIWTHQVKFSRVALGHFFEHCPNLIRAKGLMRTGKEWQLVQWSEGQLTFTDQAWRADSRLEMLFDATLTPVHWQALEAELAQCMPNKKTN